MGKMLMWTMMTCYVNWCQVEPINGVKKIWWAVHKVENYTLYRCIIRLSKFIHFWIKQLLPTGIFLSLQFFSFTYCIFSYSVSHYLMVTLKSVCSFRRTHTLIYICQADFLFYWHCNWCSCFSPGASLHLSPVPMAFTSLLSMGYAYISFYLFTMFKNK